MNNSNKFNMQSVIGDVYLKWLNSFEKCYSFIILCNKHINPYLDFLVH